MDKPQNWLHECGLKNAGAVSTSRAGVLVDLRDMLFCIVARYSSDVVWLSLGACICFCKSAEKDSTDESGFLQWPWRCSYTVQQMA